MDIFYLTEENFKYIDPVLLLEENKYQEVKDLVMSIGDEGYSNASEFAVILTDKLSKVTDKMPRELAIKYLYLLKILKLYGFRSLSDKEKEKFVSEQILELFNKNEVDIQEQVAYILKAYFDAPEIIKAATSILLTGLEKNIEFLGSENIIVTISGEEKMVDPSLKNWLLDYNGTVHSDPATHRRSGFEQTNYMLHAPNVQKLSKEDKNVFLRIIQFYDWLKFGQFHYDFKLPGQASWEDKVINVEQPTKFIPDDIRGIIENMRSEKVSQGEVVGEAPNMKAERFVVPQVQNVVRMVSLVPKSALPVEEIKRLSVSADPVVHNIERIIPDRQIEVGPAVSAPKVPFAVPKSTPRATVEKEKIVENPLVQPLKPVEKTGIKVVEDFTPQARPVNIQNLLREKKSDGDEAGLKMVGQNAANGVKQGEIDKKLEELKKKIKI